MKIDEYDVSDRCLPGTRNLGRHPLVIAQVQHLFVVDVGGLQGASRLDRNPTHSA